MITIGHIQTNLGNPIMELILALFFVGGLCFIVIVLPLWLILHFARNKRAHRILAREDREELKILEERAEELDERVQNLEAILDRDVPRWRSSASHTE